MSDRVSLKGRVIAELVAGNPAGRLKAAIRFISAEPLLGSLFPPDRLDPCFGAGSGNPSQTPSRDGASRSDGRRAGQVDELGQAHAGGRKPLDLTGIDWLIVGGESRKPRGAADAPCLGTRAT